MARIRKMVICPKCGEKKIIENETEQKNRGGGGGVSAWFWSPIPQPCKLGMTSSGYWYHIVSCVVQKLVKSFQRERSKVWSLTISVFHTLGWCKTAHPGSLVTDAKQDSNTLNRRVWKVPFTLSAFTGYRYKTDWSKMALPLTWRLEEKRAVCVLLVSCWNSSLFSGHNQLCQGSLLDPSNFLPTHSFPFQFTCKLQELFEGFEFHFNPHKGAGGGGAPQASYDKRRHRNCFQTWPLQAFRKK